ncbi:hypothetical protein HDV00_008605 [Rhizophlyctis rosea]|nr:hypothetical protein HDV00_008605 [Rhizophlyctis rosea]
MTTTLTRFYPPSRRGSFPYGLVAHRWSRSTWDSFGQQGAQMSANDPKVLHYEKVRIIKLQKQDRGNWDEKLASWPEAIIKAERDFYGSITDLQQLQADSAQMFEEAARTRGRRSRWF